MAGRIPRVTKTEAVVLRHRRLGDADRIVTLLTPHRGKLDVVAKGVLRTRSRMSGHLEPLTRVEVVLAHGRSLDIVTQAQALDVFLALHADLDRLSAALYLLELTDRFSFEDVDSAPLYDLLHASLVRMARGDGMQLVMRTFELALLEIAGFRPEWIVCIDCGREVRSDDAAWSPAGGGVLCAACRGGHADASPLDATALRVLRAYQEQPYEEAARIRLNPELALRMERLMHEVVRGVAERELKSAEFVMLARRMSMSATIGQTPAGAEERRTS